MNKIHFVYLKENDKIEKVIATKFPNNLNELSELIIQNFNISSTNFFNSYDLYLKITFKNEQIYETYINSQDDIDDVFKRIQNLEEINIYIKDKNINIKIFNSTLLSNNSIQKSIKLSFIAEYKNYNITKEINDFKSFKYFIKIPKNDKEIPENSYLWCIPDNNGIFFLPTKKYKFIHDEDEKKDFYEFEVDILFKNKTLQGNKYKLNYKLMNDKKEILSIEKGSLIIQLIGTKK